MILPGATLGMLGGGQLGRMFAVAARTLGYRVCVLDPDPVSPAGTMADKHLCARFDDADSLRRMAESCDAVTTEFENIPAGSVRALESRCLVHPSAHALEATQDRIREKTFIRDLGLPTAAFRTVRNAGELATAVDELRMPCILKRSSLGYDGKGQFSVSDIGTARRGFAAEGEVPSVLEERIDLEREISVILSRHESGLVRCFPVAENEHRHGILDVTIVPARISPERADEARQLATRLAEALEYVGVMAVEFFVTGSGTLLVNEIAPRPHNSGHYTLDACVTSQFEQQVRMLCGLPPGDTRLLTPVVMTNLLGDLWSAGTPPWERLFAEPGIKLHLYGKTEPRPGRKMGHFCYLHEDTRHARARSHELHAELGGEPVT
ncbi:MAG: 5-(carboxyamino)imidazole ribonucleotide synthase [Gammaproteobacteria bacterium]|jgi:5-(carboxyamino)imidazole ribonucleotide synthase|nr:5-(carboxyamino)imidazole ribonucleotide synthase [Gammaproteobacteria bacterium]